MAKNKKEMTPEERLAAALVPEEEQPYELPEGWKWVYGKGFFLPMETEYPTGDSFRYIDIESIDNSVQRVRCPKNLPVKKAPSRASRKLHIGDTLFSMVRPYLKNIAYIDEEYSDCIGSTGFYVCTPTPLVDRHYLYWLMVSPFVVNGLNHFMKGDNSPSIRKGDIEKFVYPIPLLSEQQRLVARIESLFAKLDAAKAKVQAVLDAHETRKAALLDEAFRGKLTETLDETSTAEDFLDEIYAVKAQLVKEKKIKKPKRLPSMTDEEKPFEIPNTWRWVRFGDILRIINGDRGKNYPSKKELHEAGDIPFISALNIQDNTIATEHLLYVDEERYNLLRSGKLKKGDLVLCIRGSLGKNGRYPFDRGAIASSLVIIRSYLDNDAMYDYISFYLDSLLFKNEMSKYDNGTAQPNLGAGDLSLFAVPLPPLAEQHEIVAVLDRLLGREEEVRQSAESVLAAIDSMKQSILARAFRGELGA